MFVPKVAKPHTKANESPTRKLAPQHSAFATRPFGSGASEQADVLQKGIGNQATLRLLSQQARNLIENEPHGHNEHEADRASPSARGATPGVSWDFSKIPVFPPQRTRRPQALSPLDLAPLPGVIQPKLAVGRFDDLLEHEAGRVAGQVMRMPAAALWITAASPQHDPASVTPNQARGGPDDDGGTSPAVATITAAAGTGSGGVTLSFKTSEKTDKGCGAYRWKGFWQLGGVTSSNSGYVVQEITYAFEDYTCENRNAELGSGRPVSNQGATDWEGWEVKGGECVGGRGLSDSDVFEVASRDGYYGLNAQDAHAKYIEGYTEPAKWGTIPEAGSAPATRSKPAGWSNAGALYRWIRSDFNCCFRPGEDTLTTSD